MIKANLLINTALVSSLLRLLFNALLLSLLFINPAHANNDVLIKKVFIDFDTIQFGDTVAAPWRIVQAQDWKAAQTSKLIIAQGISSPASVAKLSLKQREALYKAWQKTPNAIWVLYFPQPEHLELVNESGKYFINLVMSQSDDEVAQTQAADKAYSAGQKPLNPAIYTQIHFNAKPYENDYADWQQRFKQDIAEFDANMRKNRDFGKKLFEDKDPLALKQVFLRSISTGKKGLSLRNELISAYYAAPGHDGTEITPGGSVFTELVLSKGARPVGFGGTFNDDNTQVDLWYMVFDEMSGWTKQEFNDSIVFEAFKRDVNPTPSDAAATPAGREESPKVTQSAELPLYKTIKRNRWPALVFTREADGKIKL